jgi:hypothetical protein
MREPLQAAPEPLAGGEPRALTITKRRMGGLLVVSLSGRMTEDFQGQALAREVSGRVLFDLAGLERVTSFGVREWLQMLNEASSRLTELTIARCSEPIVNQVSMIRRFVGDGRIVSFYGPYRCESCGGAFNRLFDCERDAEIIRSAEPPPSPCPRCGAQGTFDDDAESYFAFATPYAGQPVPREVRAVLEDLSRAESGGAGEAIEKIIDGRVTRLRVSSRLDGSVRWKRALDGIEGDLVIDLASSTGAAPEGVRALELALRALGEEVKTIRIDGCPPPLIEHLIAAKPPLCVGFGAESASLGGAEAVSGAVRRPGAPSCSLEIASALVDARCDSCNAMRSTLLDIKEGIAAALEDRDPYVPCKRCNAPLSFAPLRPLLRRMAGVDDGPVAGEEAPSGDAPAPSAKAGAALPAVRSRWPPLIAAALGAAVTLGVGLAYRRSMTEAPHGAGSAAPSGGASSVAEDAPPAWAAQPFVIEGDRVLVVGRGAGATREAALATARNEAIAEIVRSLSGALAGSPLHELLQSRGVDPATRGSAEAVEAYASRYLRYVGAFATPERVEARFQEDGGTVTAVALYRLNKQSFDAAAESYRRTVRVLGLTAAPLFPLLERRPPVKGEVVVVAVEERSLAGSAGIRPGDVIVGVNGKPVGALDALESAVRKPSGSGAIEVELEAGGARHTARIIRPAGQR